MKLFKNKICVITGAASGIGKTLAEHLVRYRANVILTDINEELLFKTAGLISKNGHKTQHFVVDVTKLDDVKTVIDSTVSQYGRIDYLFNNAGIGVGGEARYFSYDDWANVIDVNLYGVVNGVFAAYPVMVNQGFGHIINTASLYGLVPAVCEISYVASKYGVVGLSHALRVEGSDLGVKVSVVCPGFIETPILQTSKAIGIEKNKARELYPKTITPEKCVKKILTGIRRNKATIVVTPFAKSMWLLHRLNPALVRYLLGRALKKIQKL